MLNAPAFQAEKYAIQGVQQSATFNGSWSNSENHRQTTSELNFAGTATAVVVQRSVVVLDCCSHNC